MSAVKAAVAGMVLLIAGGCASSATLLFAQPAEPSDVSIGCGPGAISTGDTAAAGQVGLTGEQTANAQVIINLGRQRGIPPYGWIIAGATAMQESDLQNLPGGHGTSVGLFQLIDDHGSAAQRQNPAFSTGWFYDGLVKVPGWRTLPVTVAAQRVQRSAFPLAYAKHEQVARQIVATLTSTSTNSTADGPVDVAAVGVNGCGTPLGTTECPPGPRASVLEVRLAADSVRLSRCILATFGGHPLFGATGGWAPGSGHIRGSDHYKGLAVDYGVQEWQNGAGTALGDAIAGFAITNSAQFGVRQIIWNHRIWHANTGQWKPYQHSCFCSDPTLQHDDHVHIGTLGFTQTASTGT